MFVIASAFDAFFGGKEAFYQLESIRALWKLSCIIGILFLATGVFRFRKSKDAKALINVLMRAVICGALMLPFCKMAETLKNESAAVKAKTGFTPAEMNLSLNRIAERTEQLSQNTEENSTASWYDLSAKAADSIGRVVLTNLIAGITAVAWLAVLILKVFYLIHDFIFYSALLIAPLAFGLTGSGFFDPRRGISFIFTVLGVSIWPFFWLFVDAVVLMTLKPIDPQIGGSSVIKADAMLYAPIALDGTFGLVTSLVLMVVITCMIFFGYIMSIRLAHWVFGSIGGGIMEMGAGMLKGSGYMAARLGIAAATGGTSIPAGAALATRGAGGATSMGIPSGSSGGGGMMGTPSGGGGSFAFKPHSAGQMFSTLKGTMPSAPKPLTSNWRANNRIKAESEAV
jgi:hypothetical protein